LSICSKRDEAIFCCFEGMKRSVYEFKPSAEGKEQQRAREHVKRVFGREPEAIRPPKLCGLRGVCFARVGFGVSNPIEFILSDGVLIGIPPGKHTYST
jgi:hypothetical protein